MVRARRRPFARRDNRRTMTIEPRLALLPTALGKPDAADRGAVARSAARRAAAGLPFVAFALIGAGIAVSSRR
jgi:hypothetical protein